MKNFAKRALSLLLLVLITAGTIACSNPANNPSGAETTTSAQDNASTTTTTATSETTTAQTEPEYVYPDVNYGGYKFRMLNFDGYVNCNIRLDAESQTGERLNDAIYTRNQKVESELGIEIVEIAHPFTAWSASQKELIELVIKSVSAGDDDYDAAFLNVKSNINLMTGGSVHDLTTIETLNLNEDWWDTKLNDTLTVNGKLYAASTPMHLVSSDLAWCLLFNEEMMKELKLDAPYQLVKDGKWTLDVLAEYAQKAANLNGDDSFTWNKDGKAVYGIAAHATAAHAFWYGAENRMVTREGENFTFTLGTERFYNTVEKLKTFNNAASGYIRYNNGGLGNADGYIDSFANRRSLFMTCELKSVMEEREMKDTFGLLPMPKYDEAQENYHSFITTGTMLMTVPASVKNLDRTGVILDALSYESAKDVLPVYYDVTVSYQGLRNAESVEMLQIIRDSRSIEIGMVLAMTSAINSPIEKLIANNEGEAVSIITANKTAVEEKIKTVLDAFK